MNIIACAGCRAPIKPTDDAVINAQLMAPMHLSCSNLGYCALAIISSPLIDVLAAPDRWEGDVVLGAIAMVSTRHFVHFKGGSYYVTRLLRDESKTAEKKAPWARFVVEYRRVAGSVLCARPLDEFLERTDKTRAAPRRFWPLAQPILKGQAAYGIIADYNESGLPNGIETRQCSVCLTLYCTLAAHPGRQLPCPHCGQEAAYPVKGSHPMFENDLKKGMNETAGDDRLEKHLAAIAPAKAKTDDDEDEVSLDPEG